MKRTLFLLFALAGCAVAPFSQQSVDTATVLRDEATALMANAVEPFADHSDSVDSYRARLQAAVESESLRENNSESIAQWGLIADPQGALLGGFFTRWEQNGTLGQLFVNEKRVQVVRAFDIIISTEEAKR